MADEENVQEELDAALDDVDPELDADEEEDEDGEGDVSKEDVKNNTDDSPTDDNGDAKQ
jgi:hypothetical protein